VKAEEAKYMLMTCHQNAGENHNLKISNEVFEKVKEFISILINEN
jgi:hypothetical protein